jgi:hypothetical protein
VADNIVSALIRAQVSKSSLNHEKQHVEKLPFNSTWSMNRPEVSL